MKVSAEAKSKEVSLDELQMGIYMVGEDLKLNPIDYGITRYRTVIGHGIAADYHVSRKANIFITVERVELK